MNFLTGLLISVVCAFIAMVVHEMTKSIVAYLVTHPIYREKNKINLNILEYVDPLGLIMFAFMNVGWQKPHEYNSFQFRDKSKGLIAVALSGILANLLLMSVLIPMLRLNLMPVTAIFVLRSIYFNFTIAIINLLPIPPFDMTKIIQSYSSNAYFKLMQNERIIHTIFILLLITGMISRFINSLFQISIYPLI